MKDLLRKNSGVDDGDDSSSAPQTPLPSPPKTKTEHETTPEEEEEEEEKKPEITLGMLFDRNQPWVLVKGGSFLNFFDFVPHHYRHGPWSMAALLGFPTLLYLLAVAAIWADAQRPTEGGWWSDEATQSLSSYYYQKAYTSEWYYTLAAFLWMSFICWNVYTKSPLHGSAWISFTLWSWTVITVRHALCVLAPFAAAAAAGGDTTIPSSSPITSTSSTIILLAEMLRFPCLLSASMTFGIWNFVLFPVILVFFMKDSTKRWQFFGYMTNFRLTQLHVCNIWFAVANAALTGPIRTLHLGDVLVVGAMMVIYMCWYYFVLDRLGIHLYPIFTPRSNFVVLGWLMIVAVCLGGYQFWNGVLESLVVAKGADGGLTNNVLFLLGY